jgi:hypothetical protein
MSPEQIAVAAQFGIDISPEAMALLSEEDQRARLQELTLLLQDNSGGIVSAGTFVPTVAQIRTGKRESFAKALEDAFWDMGGVHFLKDIAIKQPLEFAKLAVKLLPIATSDAMPQATFIFNVPKNDERVIEHESNEGEE